MLAIEATESLGREPSATLFRMTTTGRTVTGGADLRLATYGTLAPGRPNHEQLSDLSGWWLAGHVRGSLVEAGWGARLGYPGLILDANGPVIEVDVFVSEALPEHWLRLDAFEGPGYRRVAVDVSTAEGVLRASIYVLARSQPASAYRARSSAQGFATEH